MMVETELRLSLTLLYVPVDTGTRSTLRKTTQTEVLKKRKKRELEPELLITPDSLPCTP
jgi:hypothetical protein